MSRKMKYSGVEWINDIPIEWEIRRYKNFAKSGMGNTILKEDLKLNGIPIYSATKDDTIFGYVENSNLLLSEGDFVIPARGNSIGNVTLVKQKKATCTQTTIYSKVENIEKKFLYYCSKGLKDYWYQYDDTAIPQITVKQIQNNVVPYPMKTEQILISNYLDDKMFQIDSIIKKQTQLIEEYKNYKQSLITETVTKGLNPDVKMKDSGIEWIGEIPEHWEVRKIKQYFDVISGSTPKSENKNYWDGNITWVTPADYNSKQKYVCDSKRKITIEGLNSCGTTLVPKNSIIISTRAPIGTVAITGANLCTNQGCKSLVNRSDKLSTDILYYYLSIFGDVLNMFGKGTTFLELSTADLKNLVLPISPIEEQKQIAAYLDKKCSHIDTIIKQKQQLIKELEAYKKSLIYECVTGKREIPTSEEDEN